MAEYTLCEKADELINWDAFHGTEKIAEDWVKEIWDGHDASKMVSPINLRTLFELSSCREEQLAELETYAGGSGRSLFQVDS